MTGANSLGRREDAPFLQINEGFIELIREAQQSPPSQAGEDPEDRWARLFDSVITLSLRAERLNCVNFILKEKAKHCLSAMQGKGFRINTPINWRMAAPLQEAARVGSTLVSDVLLQLGANINGRITSTVNEPPLHIAARCGQSRVVQLLVDCGANVHMSSTGDNPSTPLMNGAYFPEIIQILTAKGADIHAKCSNPIYGKTALQKAVRGGAVPAVDLLIRLGGTVTHDLFQDVMKEIVSASIIPKEYQGISGWKYVVDRIVNYVNILFLLMRKPKEIIKSDSSTITPLPQDPQNLQSKINKIKEIASKGDYMWDDRANRLKLEAGKLLALLQ